jgi:transcriptional regulator with XRE-family HTH domain
MITIRIDFKRLKDAAEAKKLSTYKIAAADGTIPAPTVLKIIKGSRVAPSAINLKRICDVLEIPVQEVFIKDVA